MKLQITENDIQWMAEKAVKKLYEHFNKVGAERMDAIRNGADYEWDDIFTTDVPKPDDEKFNSLLDWCRDKKPELSEDELKSFAGNIWYKKEHKRDVYLYDKVPEDAILCQVRASRPEEAAMYVIANDAASETSDGGYHIYQLTTDAQHNPGRLLNCTGWMAGRAQNGHSDTSSIFNSIDEAKAAMVEHYGKNIKRPAKPVQVTYGPLGSTPDPSTGDRYYKEPGHYYGD